MLKKGAIETTFSQEGDFQSQIFIVPKKDGSYRPVINLKLLNQFIPYKHFKMEGLHMLKDLLREGDSGTPYLFLLQHLGFGINWEKSYLVPTQEIEFLGFLINSVTMRMFLPESKILQIINQCANLAHKTLVSVRELAQIIGRMTASVAAIIPAPLQCRYLQMTRTRSLIHNKSYETLRLVTLSPECKTELQWWCHHLRDFNGKAIICPCPDLMITSDASKKGWGAHSQGIQTGGAWTAEEAMMHINALELLAAFLALKTFTKDKQNLTVLLK
ncbi:uncharacterized protein [Ptychodera flava]|uniref:uncharacterized protein n=1 Tax=Ptychodera flava TaxID=63121 RepID=UPI00396A9032